MITVNWDIMNGKILGLDFEIENWALDRMTWYEWPNTQMRRSY